jgi:hypothetical protein
MSTVKEAKEAREAVETTAVNEMRAAFGLPANVSVDRLWAVARGEARELCARAEPPPDGPRPFEGFLEAVRRNWRRPEPPPTHGEVSFLASLCGRSGLSEDGGGTRAEQIGRFLYALLRFTNFSGSFPRITIADLDALEFSVHLDLVEKKAS